MKVRVTFWRVFKFENENKRKFQTHSHIFCWKNKRLVSIEVCVFFFVCLTILVANNEMNKKPAGNDDAICLLVVGVEK